MSYDEFHKMLIQALYQPGRSGEQVSEVAHRILWRMAWTYRRAQTTAYFDILSKLTEREGSTIKIRGGSRKLRQFPNLVEKRTSALFRKLLHAQERRILKRAGVTLDDLLKFLQSEKAE